MKKYLIYLSTILLSFWLCACGDISEEAQEIVDTIIDEGNISESILTNRYGLGDTVEMHVVDGEGSINITITDWGTTYDEFFGFFTYISYEIENTGSTPITLGNSMFNVYADNYIVEQNYLMEDAVASSEISGGRRMNGSVYVECDPDNVTVLEIECGDSVWVLKEPTPIVGKDAIPAEMFRDTGALPYTMSGEYGGITGMTAYISMYSSVEDQYVGNFELYGDTWFSGQLVEIDTNVYQVTTSDGSVLLIGVYSDNENICFDMYINGEHIDYFMMYTMYES